MIYRFNVMNSRRNNIIKRKELEKYVIYDRISK